MQSIEYRYLHDRMVKELVDSLEHHIHELQFTPSEVRECAMLAAIHYEQRRPPQNIMEAKPELPTTRAMDEIAILKNAIESLTSGNVRDQLLIRLDAVTQLHQ